MSLRKPAAFLLLTMLVTHVPAWAEEAVKPDGESASETGKNEIPVCPKLVPIQVALSSDYPAADRVEVVEIYEVPKRVEYAVACELERQGYGAAKPFQLKITITKFRLRSGANAALGGFASGADRLGMNVEVLVQGEAEPWRFDEGDSTMKGGWFMPAPSQRLNTMVQKTAKDLISKVKKKGYLKEA